MSYRRRGAVLAVLVFTLVSALAAGAAQADTLPPSLAGEALVAGPNSTVGDGVFGVSVQCNPDQSGSFTFSASGTATGPYPGTFVESGSVTVNTLGAVAAFHADFQIVDSLGVLTVHGSKDLVADASDLGACFSDAYSYDAEFATRASYSATIDTASGSYRDTGSSTTTGEGADVLGFFSLHAPEGAFSTFT
jgi:hypothetical protein